MGVVLLQILQWILRIILFLLLLILILLAIILTVPIRYQAEGEFLEKKPGVRGKITWFFYLIYMRFCYEEEFRIQVRVLGFKVFDSTKGEKKPKKAKSKKKNNKTAQDGIQETVTDNSGKEISVTTNVENAESEVQKTNVESAGSKTMKADTEDEENKVLEVRDKNVKMTTGEDELAAWEKEMEAEAEEEAEHAKQVVEKNAESSQNGTEHLDENSSEKEKKSFSEKIDDIKSKIQNLIQKIKDIIAKIRDGKLKAEHYLELWNRNETQITFSRAKKKLTKMIKAILPRKWEVRGNIGLTDPCTTGQLMGVLGAMYPILGNRVQIVPDFEKEVLNIEGNLKGHIRLGNLLYQLISLVLNRHCFKFIKLIFDELGSSKKKNEKA